MIALLQPLAAWMAGLLLLPIAIHLLGRRRLRRRDFPSLLLLREGLARSMRRHRLRNLLLLLLRLLLIVMALLAAANPVYRARENPLGTLPGSPAYLLFHNGVHALPNPSGLSQEPLLRRLGAEASGRLTVEAVIPGISGPPYPRRYGNPAAALERLLDSLPAAPGALFTVHIPVYRFGDMLPLREALVRAAAFHAGASFLLHDFSAAHARLEALPGLRVLPEGPAAAVSPAAPAGLRLEAALNPALAGREEGFLVLTQRGSVQSRIPARGPSALLEVAGAAPSSPAPPFLGARGRIVSGAVRFEGKAADTARAFPVTERSFAVLRSSRSLLLHAGSTLATLPSLGPDSPRRPVLHLARSEALAGDEGALLDSSLLVFLAAGETGEEALDALAAWVRKGGTLVLTVGRSSDAAALSRRLLHPLGLGRLGEAMDIDSLEKPRLRAGALAEVPAFAGLAALAGRAGWTGGVGRLYAWNPGPAATVLAEAGGKPLLLFGAIRPAAEAGPVGRVLLWTTDLDDLDWTGIGIGSLPPLLVQALAASAAGEAGTGENLLEVHSDSIWPLPARGNPEGTGLALLKPDGLPFQALDSGGETPSAGPFDTLGLHRLALGPDSLLFAVNLAPAEDSVAEKRALFLGGEPALPSNLVLRDAALLGKADAASALAIRPAFLLAAILLLLAEIVLSRSLGLRT